MSLCQSLLNYEQRIEAAYFEAVRTLLTRVEAKGKVSFREINGRINELLKQSIKSEWVINPFLRYQGGVLLFDSKFLEEVARMKERNFAVELLRRLIAEQVQLYQRTNTVRAEKFSGNSVRCHEPLFERDADERRGYRRTAENSP